MAKRMSKLVEFSGLLRVLLIGRIYEHENEEEKINDPLRIYKLLLLALGILLLCLAYLNQANRAFFALGISVGIALVFVAVILMISKGVEKTAHVA